MICTACRDREHWRCVDVDRESGELKAGRMYRSCNCQHVDPGAIVPKPEVSMGADE